MVALDRSGSCSGSHGRRIGNGVCSWLACGKWSFMRFPNEPKRSLMVHLCKGKPGHFDVQGAATPSLQSCPLISLSSTLAGLLLEDC